MRIFGIANQRGKYLFLTHLVAALLDDLDEILLDSFLEAAWDLVRQRLRAT